MLCAPDGIPTDAVGSGGVGVGVGVGSVRGRGAAAACRGEREQRRGNTTRRVVIEFSIGTRFERLLPRASIATRLPARIPDVYTALFYDRLNGWVTAAIQPYGVRKASRREAATTA